MKARVWSIFRKRWSAAPVFGTSLLAMAGWYTESSLLVQVLPHSATIQFNGTLGLLLGALVWKAGPDRRGYPR